MHDEHFFKTVGDVAAASISFAVFAKWIPVVAGLFSIIWTGIRFYEWAKEKITGNPT